MGFDTKNEIKKALAKTYPLIILIIILSLVAYVFIRMSGATTKDIFDFLSTIDVDEVRAFVSSFSIYAPLVFVLLQISQAVIAPIPGFVFTIAGAILFGPLVGGIYTILGSMIGAVVCFLIARKYGRPFVEKITKHEGLESLDYFFEKRGFILTFLLRAVPVVSFGLMSYLFGVTSVRFKDYVLGTFLGLIPVTIFYTYVGYILLENPQISIIMGIVMLILFAVSPIYIPFIKHLAEKEKMKK